MPLLLLLVIIVVLILVSIHRHRNMMPLQWNNTFSVLLAMASTLFGVDSVIIIVLLFGLNHWVCCPSLPLLLLLRRRFINHDLLSMTQWLIRILVMLRYYIWVWLLMMRVKSTLVNLMLLLNDELGDKLFEFLF